MPANNVTAFVNGRYSDFSVDSRLTRMSAQTDLGRVDKGDSQTA